MQYEYDVKGSKYIASKAIEIKDLKFSQSKNKLIGTKIIVVYLPVFPEINNTILS